MMNRLDFLLDKSFAQHSLAEKTQIVRVGADHPLDFTFTQNAKVLPAHLATSDFRKKAWMTCSRSKCSVFCFPCMLFTDATSPQTTNGLADTFSETFMLLPICLTTPVSSAESNAVSPHWSVSKTFLGNTMTNGRVNVLAVLSVQKYLIHGISELNSKVNDRFACQKNRRICCKRWIYVVNK